MRQIHRGALNEAGVREKRNFLRRDAKYAEEDIVGLRPGRINNRAGMRRCYGGKTMLAVKAIYDNGKVIWKKAPQVEGRHELTVIFEDYGAQPQDKNGLKQPSPHAAASWDGVRDLIGCVSARTDASERHDDYLTGQ